MLHCSHCLTHREPDRFDDFVCCSGCGKVLGQFFGGKYIDHSKPILGTATKLKKRKKEKKQQLEKIRMDTTDQLAA
ncbi:hypothetical protein Csa_021665 [Cucumis sativus]|uniref:Uncharacterized protein n=1 Tax=Cucumis sativus TaxID=3659 RepID=A0A0A0L0C4_CUCSA|nr:hypothetical protein Csa_021665 [Cucumis sativus]